MFLIVTRTFCPGFRLVMSIFVPLPDFPCGTISTAFVFFTEGVALCEALGDLEADFVGVGVGREVEVGFVEEL